MDAGAQRRVRSCGGQAPVAIALIFGLLSLAKIQAQAGPSKPDDLATINQAIDHCDWGAAERILRHLITSAPGSADPHFLLGYVLFREQRALDSLGAYTEAARIRSPTADDLIVVASDYVLLKDYSDAERWLVSATAQSPENARAWYLLGRTQYNLDQNTAAAASFRRRLQLVPNDVRAEYNLGLALEKLDRPADAEAAYRAAIEWQQNTSARDPQPYLDLGMLLLTRHRPEEALGMLRQAVEIGSRNALAYQELGLVQEALGHTAEAVAALERASMLAPEAEQPHFLLGRMYRKLGRNAEASGEFARVKTISGSHSNKDTPNEPSMVDDVRR